MSNDKIHSSIVTPKGVWWTAIPKQEKIWITIAFVWCLILFAMMPLWHIRGGQNPTGIRGKVDPGDYMERTLDFADEFQIGTDDSGIPIVEPPPGGHAYLVARMWSWYPVIQFRKGKEYILHLSSTDINHGFGLFPLNINFQVVPGYDYALRITPNEAGDFRIVCNEFCGINHHLMVGRIIVVD